MQVLLNIVILGVFSIVENWLLFFYGQSWILVVIFGVLMILVSCLLAINIFNCVKSITETTSTRTQKQQADSGGNDKQIYALLYKQMKEIQKNQLLSTKAVLDKMSSISSEDKEQILEMLQTMAADFSVKAEKEVPVPEDIKKEQEDAAKEPEEDASVAEDMMQGQEEAVVEPEEDASASEDVPKNAEELAIEDILGGEPLDPNKELTPDEIAALFDSVN